MIIDNAFEVAGDPAAVWDYLNDTDAVARCVPGTEITRAVDDSHWEGSFATRIGPVALTFAGTMTIVERDPATRTLVLEASGTERRGKGTARVRATITVEPTNGATQVNMTSDLTLNGPAAQLGRGLIPSVAAKLTAKFAACLESAIAERS